MTAIHPTDLARYHAAAKIIEVDAEEGYWTCRQRFGADIANMALIAYYRFGSGSTEGYPPEGGYERVAEEVNRRLENVGLLKYETH